ncbi:MAG: hypothetical protein SWH68_05920 [Thermodesulfobacteriota bacterium]|nr:hypothetical protein [Thermodesulfobacteriota bacterium]
MTTVMPKGERIKKAVKWVSDERQAEPDKAPKTIADEAILKFDLTPNEAEFLVKFVRGEAEA